MRSTTGYFLNGDCNYIEWCTCAGPISWVLGAVIASEIWTMPPPYASREIVMRFGEGPQRNSNQGA